MDRPREQDDDLHGLGANTLVDHFQNHCDVRFASTVDLPHEVHRVRFDVYCREFGYEDPTRFPDELDRDADDDAAHCLIVHRASGLPAGTIRVAMPPDSDAELALPMERHCAESLTRDDPHPAALPRQRVGEVSRLAVARWQPLLFAFEPRRATFAACHRRGVPALTLLLGRGKVAAAPWGYQVDAYRNGFRRTWRPGGNRHPLQRLALRVARRRVRAAEITPG